MRVNLVIVVRPRPIFFPIILYHFLSYDSVTLTWQKLTSPFYIQYKNIVFYTIFLSSVKRSHLHCNFLAQTETMSSMAFLSHPYFFAALTLLVLQFLFRKLNKRDGKRYHPVAGTVFNQLMNFHRLHHYMTHLAAKYRTYRLLNLFRYEVYTAEPSNVEYILKTNFENYGKVKTLFING